ncbi:MAG: recombinase family protein [Gammaproteobacteria bacterium]|nr:recombinase family protein [Gammaproteobacteria bacterium]
MPTAFSYVRFSSKEQIQGDSIRRQLEATKSYCESKNLTLSDKSFKDFGISAYKNVNRPSLEDMMVSIDAGIIKEGDYIILESLDRLSRKGISATQHLITGMVKKGVNIVALNEGLELNSGNSDDLVTIIRIAVAADLAFQESKKKSERIRAAWQNKNQIAKTENKPRTKMIPSWIKLSDDGQEFELDKDKVKTINTIFVLFSRGMGRRGIASKFNDENVPHISTHTRTKGTWYPSFIQKIINNEAVVGTFTPTKLTEDGKRIPDLANKIEKYYPEAVSETLFNKVQAIIKSNEKKGGRQGKRMSNVLQGAIYCSSCRSTMQYVNKNSKTFEFYLRCSKASVKACTNTKLFRYQLIERSVVEIIGLEGYKREVSALNKFDTDAKQIDKDIAERIQEKRILENKFEVFFNAVESDFMREKFAELDKQIKKIEDEIEKLTHQKQTKSDSDEEYLTSLTFEDISKGSAEERIEFNRYLRKKLKLSFNSSGKVQVKLIPPMYSSKFIRNVPLTEITVNGTEAFFRFGGQCDTKQQITFVNYELGNTSIDSFSF